MESWIEQLLPIIEEYRGGAVSFANDENEPLDGDEVDDLFNEFYDKFLTMIEECEA